LQYASIAYECGWGAVLNHNKKLKFTLLHNLAVGTVSLFPPYKSTILKLLPTPAEKQTTTIVPTPILAPD